MKKTLKKRRLTTPPLRKRQRTLKKRPLTHPSSAADRPDRVAFVAAQLFAMFPDEESARAWFEHIRWSEGRFCPYCFSFQTKPVPRSKPMPYRCPTCREYFSVRTGTVMQSSRLSVRTWAVALALLSRTPTGISSRQMQRALDIAQSTALSLGQRMRTAWQDYVELFERPVAGEDTTAGVTALPSDPEALARALFWRHDQKRFA